jgi:hypothetical protein
MSAGLEEYIYYINELLLLLVKIIYIFIFGAPNSIYCLTSTVSGRDGGNRTRNIAVYTWRFSTLSYIVTLQLVKIIQQNNISIIKKKIIASLQKYFFQNEEILPQVYSFFLTKLPVKRLKASMYKTDSILKLRKEATLRISWVSVCPVVSYWKLQTPLKLLTTGKYS